MAIQVLPDKLTVEDLTVEFDMLSRLAVGETVATATITCEVYSGTDADAANMVSGVPTISGSIVSQRIVNGVGGVIYKLSCAIRSSNNNILVNEGYLAVRTSNASAPA